MTFETSDRDVMIFTDHAVGEVNLSDLAERFDLTYHRIAQIVRQQTREHIDQIEMNLLVAKKEGNFIGLVIPPGAQDEQNAAINYLHFVLKALANREVSTKVHYRPAHDGGIAFFLEDVTECGGSK